MLTTKFVLMRIVHGVVAKVLPANKRRNSAMGKNCRRCVFNLKFDSILIKAKQHLFKCFGFQSNLTEFCPVSSYNSAKKYENVAGNYRTISNAKPLRYSVSGIIGITGWSGD